MPALPAPPVPLLTPTSAPAGLNSATRVLLGLLVSCSKCSANTGRGVTITADVSRGNPRSAARGSLALVWVGPQVPREESAWPHPELGNFHPHPRNRNQGKLGLQRSLQLKPRCDSSSSFTRRTSPAGPELVMNSAATLPAPVFSDRKKRSLALPDRKSVV